MIKHIKHLYWKLNSIVISLLINISKFLYNHSKVANINKHELELLKGIHKGKRAFIICNGPSLNADDLKVLQKHDEISFAANLIFPMVQKTQWNPTYYVVADSMGIFTLRKTMNSVNAIIKFFPQGGFLIGKNIKGNCLFFNGDGNRQYLEQPLFSDDCSKIIYSIGTVSYISIQLAVYMGISELYIIGCDHRYAIELLKDGTKKKYDGCKNYYSGVKGISQQLAGNTWEQAIAFEAAKKYADEHGIKIYNATRGGYLETFERVEFDSLFDDK